MKTTDENKKTDAQKRVDFRRMQLKELSIKARAHRAAMIEQAISSGNVQEVEAWTMKRINDIIASWYRDSTGATDFRTFRQWLREGYAVQRGSKAFVLWARKRKASKEVQTDSGEPSEREYDFFPIAYLFSNLQVKPQEPRSHEQEKQPKEATPAAAEPTAHDERKEAAFAAIYEAEPAF